MHLKFTATLLAAVGLSLVGSSYAAEQKMSNECISPQAYTNLNACPSGAIKSEGHKRAGTSFKSAPPPQEMKKQRDLGPGDVSALEQFAERDTRKGAMQTRARQLLIQEISSLERLYKSTPKGTADHQQLILRLAEAYAELEQAAVRDKIQKDIQVQDLKKKKAPASQTTALRREISKAKAMEKAARDKAIGYYSRMASWYSKYSKIDEVLYYLAYEYEQSGDMKMARDTYKKLVATAPNSPYVPSAYLAFGELFFQEATADPSKWAFAASFYEKVLGYPAPQNKLWGYAAYKLGYVHWNQGDYAKALDYFKQVIAFGKTYSTLPNAKQLATSARRDIIPVYAASQQPDRAYNYFKPLSGDAGTSDVKTIEMMRDLGFAYLDTGHYPETIGLYKQLMGRDKSDYWCGYQTAITRAVQASKSGDKEAIIREMDAQLAARKTFATMSGISKKAKQQCDNDAAMILSESAMSWHLEAVGTGGVRGTGDEKTMDLAADTYKRVADNFTEAEFQTYEFPRIVKSDWPTLYKIKYAMADLLYFRKRWEECGPAFDAVVDADPKGPDAAEAAYASVLCYQKMYDQIHKGESDRKGRGLGPKGAAKEDREGTKGEWEKFKPKPFTEMQKGMVQAFNRYVCYITPKEGDAEAMEQYIEVKYARSRTYFEAQHWEEAALGFRDIALNHPTHDAAIFAAQLYLEAVNVLGAKREPAVPQCFDDMAADVPQFLKNFCEGEDAELNKDHCELLTRIQFDVKRLAAQKKIELADSQADKGNYKQALDNYKDGGDSYLALWKEYCEEPLGAGERPKSCEQAHEIVYNMARAYQAGRLLAKSISARKILLNDKYGMQDTDLAHKAIYEIGGNYQAIAMYAQAAEYYERYAETVKYTGDDAVQALSDAVVLRLGLGQQDEALANATKFRSKFGGRKPEQAAQIGFAIAAYHGDNGNWREASSTLSGQMMGLIDKSATLTVRMQAHALLAHASAQLKAYPAARREYASVTALWKDPAASEKAIRASGGGDREVGRALEAVGEALFYEAELTKAKVDDFKFPEYKGKKDKDGISKHIGTKVKDWYVKKKVMITEAAGVYKKIIDLQPVPPPRWVIAAGSQVGAMWGKFVADFRSAPIPKEWEKDFEIKTAYYGALDDASEPFKEQAKGAFVICMAYTATHQYFDSYSRACEEWLAANYKADFHLIDEFRGSPNKVNDPLDEQAYPLSLGGEPFVLAPKMTDEDQKQMKADAEAQKAENTK